MIAGQRPVKHGAEPVQHRGPTLGAGCDRTGHGEPTQLAGWTRSHPAGSGSPLTVYSSCERAHRARRRHRRVRRSR